MYRLSRTAQSHLRRSRLRLRCKVGQVFHAAVKLRVIALLLASTHRYEIVLCLPAGVSEHHDSRHGNHARTCESSGGSVRALVVPEVTAVGSPPDIRCVVVMLAE